MKKTIIAFLLCICSFFTKADEPYKYSFYLFQNGQGHNLLEITSSWWMSTALTPGIGRAPHVFWYGINYSNDTLQLNNYYYSEGHPWFYAYAFSIDTINLGIMPSAINYIHVMPYGTDSNDTSVILPFRDTVLSINALFLKYFSAGNQDVIVYPNPTQNKIYFQLPPFLKPKKLALIDGYGRVVKQIPFMGQKDLDVSDVTNGIYFLQFQGEQETITRKVIIQ